MPEPIDLTEVVADATDDALDTSTGTSTESTDTTEVDLQADTSTDTTTADADVNTDPAVAAAQDEFEKRWGVPAISPTGRPNRIPHPRVKQMVTKAEAEAIAKTTKELEAKWATERTPLETKVKNYEGRLEKVAQFEHVLENDPKTFLNLLSQIPAYKEFFEYVGKLAQGAGGQQQEAQRPTLDHSDMPQPDQELSDGSKVYSLDGLAKRDEWLAKKIEDRAIKQAEERFGQRLQPFEQERQNQQRHAQAVQSVEKQISEARQWPHFTELEPEVIKILKSDPNITLERAYVKAFQDVQVPKVTADRNQIRTEVLAELKKKPMNSSAPMGQVRPGAQADSGAKSIEDIIAQAARDAGLV